MQADVKEAVGFMFRWSLLGLAGLLVVSVAGILLEPSALARTRKSELVMPDFVVPANKDTRVWGFHTSRGNERALISLTGGGSSWTIKGTAYGDGVALTLPGEGEGLFAIETVGCPYGPVAFHRSESLLLRLKQGTRAFLIDADAVLASDEAVNFGPLLDELSRIGEVALFCRGPFDQYPSLRDRLRSKVGPIPAVYLAQRESRIDPLLGSARRAIGAFDRAGASRIDLITDNPDLATKVAKFVPFYRRTDVRIHLVNPPAGYKTQKAVTLGSHWAGAVMDILSPAADRNRNHPDSHKR